MNADENFLEIGKIVAAHGIRGEVKVLPYQKDMEEYRSLSNVVLWQNDSVRQLQVTGVKMQPGHVILKFSEVSDRNEASQLKNAVIAIRLEEALPLPENTYYVRDLLGCSVCLLNQDNRPGSNLGTITDIFPTGSNDVYVVTTARGKQLLLPAIHEVIRQVDVKNRVVFVTLLKGLLEDEGEENHAD